MITVSMNKEHFEETIRQEWEKGFKEGYAQAINNVFEGLENEIFLGNHKWNGTNSKQRALIMAIRKNKDGIKNEYRHGPWSKK